MDRLVMSVKAGRQTDRQTGILVDRLVMSV